MQPKSVLHHSPGEILARSTKCFLRTRTIWAHKLCYIYTERRRLRYGGVLTLSSARVEVSKKANRWEPVSPETAYDVVTILRSWEQCSYSVLMELKFLGYFPDCFTSHLPAFHFQRTWFNSCFDQFVYDAEMLVYLVGVYLVWLQATRRSAGTC